MKQWRCLCLCVRDKEVDLFSCSLYLMSKTCIQLPHVENDDTFDDMLHASISNYRRVRRPYCPIFVHYVAN